MTEEPRPAKARVWSLCWRFIRRARTYTGPILFMLFAVSLAAGTKSAQAFLLKPALDVLKRDAPSRHAPAPAEVKREAPSSVLPDFVQRLREKLERWQSGLDIQKIAYLAIGFSLLMFLFGYLRDVTTSWLKLRLLADLRNDVVRHLTYTPLGFHLSRRSGDVISRVTNDVTVAESVIQFFFDDAPVHLASVAFAVCLILAGSWKLAIVAVVLLPIYVLPLIALGRRIRKARKRSLERLGDMTQTMMQTFGGIKVVKAFGMEEAQVLEFRGQNESFIRKMLSAVRRKSLGENIYQIFLGIGIATALLGGEVLMGQDFFTAGDLGIFAMGLAIINSSLREVTKSYNRMLEASTGCERVFELLDQPRETEHDSGEALASIQEGLEFRDVTFAYDSEPVLRNVGFRAAPGEVVALVGRSGSGKTTLCDLVCRFYDPTAGEIRVGGKNLRTLRRSALLDRIAVVTQETFLFNTTIEENIRYGRPKATKEEIESAAKAAHIHDFIATLEKGYETVVGERGAKLSGGQRQRIAIARAILKNPAILILDEATSALDSESEKQVQEALTELIRSGGRQRITLVIAHRLSTIRDADKIVVLDAGRVAETGRHDELLSKDGVYAQLHRLQFAEA